MQMTLSVEKGFKRSVTFNFSGDDDVEEIFKNHAKEHEFADIAWYPSQHTAIYRYDNRVPLNTPGNGAANAFTPIPIQHIEAARAKGISSSPSLCVCIYIKVSL